MQVKFELRQIEAWAAPCAQLAGEQAQQLIEMIVPDIEGRATQTSPQPIRDIHLTNPAPVQQSTLEHARVVAPEPGIVDVGVVVAYRDETTVRLQEALDRRLVALEADGVPLEAGNELRRGELGGNELRMTG